MPVVRQHPPRPAPTAWTGGSPWSEAPTCAVAAELPTPSLEATIDLLHRARDGDQSAWDRLVARHGRALKRLAHRRLPTRARSMTDTEDVVQDAFTRVLKFVHDRDFSSPGAFLAYLRRAVINRILDELRKATREPMLAPMPEEYPTPGRSPLDEAIGKEKATRYRWALRQLRPRDQRLIVLRLEQGLSYRDIADQLSFHSADAARVATGRAVWRLARLFSSNDTARPMRGDDDGR